MAGIIMTTVAMHTTNKAWGIEMDFNTDTTSNDIAGFIALAAFKKNETLAQYIAREGNE